MNDGNVFCCLCRQFLLKLVLLKGEADRNYVILRLDLNKLIRNRIAFLISLWRHQSNIIKKGILLIINSRSLCVLLLCDAFGLFIQCSHIGIKCLLVVFFGNLVYLQISVVRNRALIINGCDNFNKVILIFVFRDSSCIVVMQKDHIIAVDLNCFAKFIDVGIDSDILRIQSQLFSETSHLFIVDRRIVICILIHIPPVGPFDVHSFCDIKNRLGEVEFLIEFRKVHIGIGGIDFISVCVDHAHLQFDRLCFFLAVTDLDRDKRIRIDVAENEFVRFFRNIFNLTGGRKHILYGKTIRHIHVEADRVALCHLQLGHSESIDQDLCVALNDKVYHMRGFFFGSVIQHEFFAGKLFLFRICRNIGFNFLVIGKICSRFLIDRLWFCLLGNIFGDRLYRFRLLNGFRFRIRLFHYVSRGTADFRLFVQSFRTLCRSRLQILGSECRDSCLLEQHRHSKQ